MKIAKLLYLTLIFVTVIYGNDKGIGESSNTGKLTISVNGMKNDSGFVRVHLYNSDKKQYFPKKTLQCYKRQVVKIERGVCSIVFDNLPNDTYCFSIHHDENSNESMDTNILGLPKEGWGISNNVKLFMRLPNFEECSFIIKGNEVLQEVEMRY